MTIVGSSAGRMVKLPLLERAGISALAGGIAGGFTNATLHPIDTVKTKLQTRGASKLYSGPLDVVSKVSKESFNHSSVVLCNSIGHNAGDC